MIYHRWSACGKGWKNYLNLLWWKKFLPDTHTYTHWDMTFIFQIWLSHPKAFLPVIFCFALFIVSTYFRCIMEEKQDGEGNTIFLCILNCVCEKAVLSIETPVLNTHSRAASVTIWMVMNSSWGEVCWKNAKTFYSKMKFGCEEKPSRISWPEKNCWLSLFWK